MLKSLTIAAAAALAIATTATSALAADKKPVHTAESVAECLQNVCLSHNGGEACLKEGKHYIFTGAAKSSPDSVGGAKGIILEDHLQANTWGFWKPAHDEIMACFQGGQFASQRQAAAKQ